MNLRQLVGIDEPYFKFNREERHYAAILFHILNHADNAERALRSVQSDWKPKDGEFGIYLEYSYARDIWHGLDFTHGDKVRISDSEAVNAVNRRKIDSILKILGQLQFDPTIVPQTSVRDFNAFFIGQSRASTKYIQSPANWHLPAFFESVTHAYNGRSDGLATHALEGVCKFKWAFRIKPDIVIHADNDRALCIELKFESAEGRYPPAGMERKLLQRRKLFAEPHSPTFGVGQTELQKFLMSELLGLDCRYLLITRHEKSDGRCIPWGEFLARLEIPSNPPQYIAEALRNFEEHAKSPPSLEAEESE